MDSAENFCNNRTSIIFKKTRALNILEYFEILYLVILALLCEIFCNGLKGSQKSAMIYKAAEHFKIFYLNSLELLKKILKSPKKL